MPLPQTSSFRASPLGVSCRCLLSFTQLSPLLRTLFQGTETRSLRLLSQEPGLLTSLSVCHLQSGAKSLRSLMHPVLSLLSRPKDPLRVAASGPGDPDPNPCSAGRPRPLSDRPSPIAKNAFMRSANTKHLPCAQHCFRHCPCPSRSQLVEEGDGNQIITHLVN